MIFTVDASEDGILRLIAEDGTVYHTPIPEGLPFSVREGNVLTGTEEDGEIRITGQAERPVTESRSRIRALLDRLLAKKK